jgi:hypothetical protein
MAFTANIKRSNISENWIFQLEYYNGDAQGGGEGGFDKVMQADGSTPNLARETLDTSETGFNVDDETVFVVGDYIKVDSEVMRVVALPTNDVITVHRGVFGTTPATHSDNAQIYWYNFLPLSFNDFTYDGVFYHGVITNSPAIRESIDFANSTSKSSNLSITMPDFNYKGNPVSQELLGTHKYINRVATVYSSIDQQTPNKIASFRINNITTDGLTVNISMVGHKPWDNISIPQVKTTTTGRYFPIVYGNYTGDTSAHGAEEYTNVLANQKLHPVQVDKTDFYYHCLAYKNYGSSETRLNYYETGFDSFIPLDAEYDAESYEGGYILKAKFDLKRHFKFKPNSAISKSFSSIDNIIDADVDHGSSNTFESAQFAPSNTSSVGTVTANLEQTWSIPSFDDPPDITSSSNNNGLTCTCVWNMTNFYGVTNHPDGLEDNKVGIFDSSTGSDVAFTANNEYDDTNNNAVSYATRDTTTTVLTSTKNMATTYKNEGGYPDGLKIKHKRTVISGNLSTIEGDDGGGNTDGNTLKIYDIRFTTTCKIDKFNTTTDGFSRVSEIEYLYSHEDGFQHGITGMSSADITDIHDAHLDVLNRFCGIDVTTNPATDIDGWSALDSARSTWYIRWWLHEPETVQSILDRMQYEGQFIFRFKQGDFSQPQYIHIANSPSSVLTLSKNDINGMRLESSNPNEIATSVTVNYERHPALNTYQNTVTGVNSTSRKNWNIETKENLKEINLDMLVDHIGDSDPTGEDKNDNFLAYQNALFGDVYLKVSLDIINPAKWVNSSLEPIEVGNIIDFNNNNMFPEKPLGFNSGSWNNLNFVITSTSRTLGKLSITARSI